MVVVGGFDPIVGPGDIGNTNFVEACLNMMRIMLGLSHTQIAGGVDHGCCSGAFTLVDPIGKPPKHRPVNSEGEMDPVSVIPIST